jgi:hypothetical protein
MLLHCFWHVRIAWFGAVPFRKIRFADYYVRLHFLHRRSGSADQAGITDMQFGD